MLIPCAQSSKAKPQALSSKQMDKSTLNCPNKPLTVKNTGAANTPASNQAKNTD
jgi:hypothetical protein